MGGVNCVKVEFTGDVISGRVQRRCLFEQFFKVSIKLFCAHFNKSGITLWGTFLFYPAYGERCQDQSTHWRDNRKQRRT